MNRLFKCPHCANIEKVWYDSKYFGSTSAWKCATCGKYFYVDGKGIVMTQQQNASRCGHCGKEFPVGSKSLTDHVVVCRKPLDPKTIHQEREQLKAMIRDLESKGFDARMAHQLPLQQPSL